MVYWNSDNEKFIIGNQFKMVELLKKGKKVMPLMIETVSNMHTVSFEVFLNFILE